MPNYSQADIEYAKTGWLVMLSPGVWAKPTPYWVRTREVWYSYGDFRSDWFEAEKLPHSGPTDMEAVIALLQTFHPWVVIPADADPVAFERYLDQRAYPLRFGEFRYWQR